MWVLELAGRACDQSQGAMPLALGVAQLRVWAEPVHNEPPYRTMQGDCSLRNADAPDQDNVPRFRSTTITMSAAASVRIGRFPRLPGGHFQ